VSEPTVHTPTLSVDIVRHRPPLISYVLWVFGAAIFLGSLAALISSAIATCATISCELQTALGLAVASLGLFAGSVLVVFGFAARSAAHRRILDERRRTLSTHAAALAAEPEH
jgi:hypothetical protein